MTYSKDDCVHPEFAFLHELGHMVHTRITQQEFTAPKSFEAMRNTIYKYSGRFPSDAPKKFRNKWLAEWFAECFAITILYGSSYASLDHHTEINNSDKEEIQTYMDVLMSTLTNKRS